MISNIAMSSASVTLLDVSTATHSPLRGLPSLPNTHTCRNTTAQTQVQIHTLTHGHTHTHKWTQDYSGARFKTCNNYVHMYVVYQMTFCTLHVLFFCRHVEGKKAHSFYSHRTLAETNKKKLFLKQKCTKLYPEMVSVCKIINAAIHQVYIDKLCI